MLSASSAAVRDQKTVLLTTHQLSMAQAVCDRVAIMAGGKLIADRPPGELLALFAGELYEIRIAGPMNGARAEFDGFVIVEDGRETVLRGAIDGHEALRRVLTPGRVYLDVTWRTSMVMGTSTSSSIFLIETPV